MEIITSIKDRIGCDTAVTVGKFDGIHKGHDLLTERIIKKEQQGLKSLVFTFDVSPRIRLQKDETKLLVTNQERINLIKKQGISYLVQCSFEEIMPLEPEVFVEYLVKQFRMKYLVCGTDFHFGKKGIGDICLLEKLSHTLGFQLEVVEKLKQNNRDISSTLVREEIARGNVSVAGELLGYHYFIWGKVVHGRHLGTRMGIPTINMIPPEDKLLPQNGVYITMVEVDHKMYHGITNVGTKPTVDEKKCVGVETHILDFHQDIYEKEVCVFFLEYIREEKCFCSVEELIHQMHHDKKSALQYFNKRIKQR